MRRAVRLLSFPVAFTLGCKEPAPEGIPAIVDSSRPEHFFDHPFPSDDLREEDGGLDMSQYPVSGLPITLPVVEGWRDRAAISTEGFGNGSSIYFRFEGPLHLPDTTEGLPTDPVLLIDLETAKLTPLKLGFTADPAGDAFLPSNLLALSPQIGHLPSPGARLAAVVMQSAGAAPPEGGSGTLDPDLIAALEIAGVEGELAVATLYTTQDGTAQLRTLAATADAWAEDTAFEPP